MDLIIKEISESDYLKLDCKELTEWNDLTKFNHFMLITASQQNFKLCWESSLIYPDFVRISDYTYCVGIDQIFFIFDFLNGDFKLSMEFDCYFIQVMKYRNFVLVITQMDIYILKLSDYSIYKTVNLPDVFSDIKFDSSVVYISCISGYELCVCLVE